MFSEEDVKELLQEAYDKGFNDGIDQTCDYICENYNLDSDEEAYSEDCFDLEDDYEYYTESKKATKELHKGIIKAEQNKGSFFGRFTPKMAGNYTDNKTGKTYDSKGRDVTSTYTDQSAHKVIKDRLMRAKEGKASRFDKGIIDNAGRQFNKNKNGSKYIKLHDKMKNNESK